ncbi:MAG: 16S rRNA methyltransferase [Chloroflexi bacterium]|nr:16S rRNA methyltransferase [Chloroflexota bacterium]
MAETAAEAVVQAVLESRKYGQVSRHLIAHLAEIELAKGRRHKEAVKEVKNRLHQVVGAYLEKRPRYAEWLEALEAAPEGQRREVCGEILAAHASSRERLDILETFYQTLLGDLPPIRSVLDVACGLNPLAVPWMPLVPGAQYLAVDVMDDLAAFLTGALPLLGVEARGLSDDVTRHVPSGRFDVALIVKAVPCLQQIDRSVGRTLLEEIDARCIVVSYPVRSLGGSEKGMRDTYAASFAQLVQGADWNVERFDFSDELAFRLTREPH